MKTLEERIARLEAALGVDEDAPSLRERVEALESLMSTLARWADRREKEAKDFAGDFRKAYVEADWKWR